MCSFTTPRAYGERQEIRKMHLPLSSYTLGTYILYMRERQREREGDGNLVVAAGMVEQPGRCVDRDVRQVARVPAPTNQ